MNRKQGISLIVLVITIIVMIILAGAIISTISQGGILGKAQEATFKNDIKNYQDILAIKKAEEEIEIAAGKKTSSELNGTSAEKIQVFMPDFKKEYEGVLVVVDGELKKAKDISVEKKEKYDDWLTEINIDLEKTKEFYGYSFSADLEELEKNVIITTYTEFEQSEWKQHILNEKEYDESFFSNKTLVVYQVLTPAGNVDAEFVSATRNGNVVDIKYREYINPDSLGFMALQPFLIVVEVEKDIIGSTIELID